MDIYIEMILFDHIIDNVDLKSNNSKESIPGIEFGDMMVSAPKTKYCWGIKGNNIEICVPPSTWRAVPNISGRDI